jgi:hypothetical protein
METPGSHPTQHGLQPAQRPDLAAVGWTGRQVAQRPAARPLDRRVAAVLPHRGEDCLDAPHARDRLRGERVLTRPMEPLNFVARTDVAQGDPSQDGPPLLTTEREETNGR